MASGKSLELQKIQKPAPDPICVCGDDFSDHFEDNKMKEKYNDGKQHYQAGTRFGGSLRR